MKMRIVATFVVIFLFSSCRNDDTSLNKVVLDKIVYHENADQIGVFEYNSNGSIRRYNYNFNGPTVQYTDFVYSDNKLSSKVHFEKNNNGSFDIISRDVFTYANDGKLEQVIKDKDGAAEYVYDFTWSDDQISRVDYRRSSLGVEYHSFIENQYDGNGNVIRQMYFDIVDDQTKLSAVLDLEYDDKTNPLADFADPNDLVLRSPNNVSKKVQRSNPGAEAYATHIITYNYNAAELPEEKTEIATLYGDVTESYVKIFYKKI